MSAITRHVETPSGAPKSSSDVWLLDCSGSMQGARIRLLKQALARWLEDAAALGVRPVMIAFNLTPWRVTDPDQLPEPEGGTRLDLALEEARQLSPAQVVVFTDGEPYDEEACLRVAQAIPGTVSCVFCGDKEDVTGLAFCRRLARACGGDAAARDVARGQSLLCAEVRDLLGLPAPRAL